MNDNDLDEIELLINNEKVIGVGEIGLDYYWDKDEDVKNQQRRFFIKQIELANKYGVKVICVKDFVDNINSYIPNFKLNKVSVW